MTARYIVGIDLGTTNSALAAIERSDAESPEISLFPILQVVEPGTVVARPLLPSSLYLAGAELAQGTLDLPWASERRFVVGELARRQGREVPGRLVSSAKSWLSHSGVDRTAPLLPWVAPGDASLVDRISPVEAQVRILEHLRDAWNDAYPSALLEAQEVLLTVPASFDAVARQLTAEAAARVGFEHLTLLEEPQAAFYSWLARGGSRWREQLTVGDVVLVCDIGGGTTDFSLIAVKDEGGNLVLERLAVGDHILLGGDNMDLALAYQVKQRLEGEGHKLDAAQLRALVLAVQQAKEALLVDSTKDSYPVVLLGRSSRVIGGSIKTALLRSEVETLAGGFFPACQADERPATKRQVGVKELGLPYAADPAVTRHLAKFLADHAQPTAILFNGGVMKSGALRERVAQAVQEWSGRAPKLLAGTDYDLAVAHGAAYYGWARQGGGVRIRGGTARAYYVGIESSAPAVPGFEPPLKALCVAPRGMEEGSAARAGDRELGLVVGEPAEFRFFASSLRKHDVAGTLLEETGEELTEIAPISTTLDGEPGMQVAVTLESRVTEVGTLELWCVARDGRRWKLEFNVRESA